MTTRPQGPFAAVAVPVPLRRLFTYSVPPALAPRVALGTRVRVPFGPRKVAGTVVDWPTGPPQVEVEIRPIETLLLTDVAPLPRALLELTRFVADYYLCSWGEAIETALPPASGAPPPRRALRRLAAADPDSLGARASVQRGLLQALPADGRAVPLDRLDTAQRGAAARLIRRGWVERLEIPGKHGPAAPDAGVGARPETPPRPTAAQAEVLRRLEPALDRGTYAPFLLFGATGSGKTEVYLRAAERVLGEGRSVLYLVPEIGLTPLLMHRVRRRFPGQAAVLHSNLAPRLRHRYWQDVLAGRYRFVLGTRSAVFAPLRDVGLIVVDEEQDGSYKQEDSPRYNGRDVAVVRAKQERAVIVLGSATPSMESFRHARSGRYELLRLGGRVERRPLPGVTLIDMRDEFERAGEVTPLSGALVEELRGAVARGEQALVLRNRRGWSVAVLCPRCGDRVSCPDCSICLTWHRREQRLRCHYCGFERPLPRQCPQCQADDLKLLGEGTEQLETLLADALPGARIERMDRDTIRRRGAHEALLRRFSRGEIDVLVGTQMIAKGHDFPRVTVVGVLSADQSLGLPDFRAGERTFQLLTQVAGRAGRGELPGKVIVQAFDTAHPVVRLAARQDYEAFYDREIRYRQTLHYPPVAALVQIIVQDRDELRARGWAENVADALRRTGEERLMLLGPGPAPLERIKGRYRQQILARTAGRRRLVDALERTLAAIEDVVPRRALTIDVDPMTVL